MGLAQICISDTPPPAQVTVHVDAKHAAQSNGQAGVVLEAGPRVGRQALEAVLCDAVVEITARREDGIPMVYGQKTMGRPFPRHYAGPSSTATDTSVSETAVTAPVDSKSIMSSPGARAGAQIRTI